MQSKNKSKKKVNHKKASLAKEDSSSKKEMKEESSSFKKLISRFLTNLCEKKYAEASKDLENAVEEKIKGKIKKAANNVQNVAAGKSNSAKKASYAKQGEYDEKKSEKGNK